MNLTFHGTTLKDVADQLYSFLADIGYGDVGDTPAAPGTEPETPPKRKRRTKAEMEAARADPPTEESEPPSSSSRRRRTAQSTSGTTSDEKPTRRRRGAKATENPTDTAETATASSRRKRGTRSNRSATTASSPSDIKDADLAKACSSLASVTNPGVVKELMEEFKVGNVAELEGDARQAFLGTVNERIDEEE